MLVKYLNLKADILNSKELNIIIATADDYSTFKSFQLEIKSLIATHNNIGTNLNQVWIFKGIGKQFLLLRNSFENFSMQIDIKSSEFDNVLQESNGFHLISENTLWEKRTKAYQYWI